MGVILLISDRHKWVSGRGLCEPFTKTNFATRFHVTAAHSLPLSSVCLLPFGSLSITQFSALLLSPLSYFFHRSSISFFIRFVVRTHFFKRSICFPVISLYDVFVYTLQGHSFYVVVIICLQVRGVPLSVRCIY